MSTMMVNKCNKAACAGCFQADGASQGGVQALLAKAQAECAVLETKLGVNSPCNLHA